ncbi:hypothetical protein R3I79_004650, partial [Escherichia coli]|nr:hypothetical protein [Escherichia coli]
IILSTILSGITSSAWAAQMVMPEMSQHQLAVIAHNTMNNSNSNAHQQIISMHKKMMGKQTMSINKSQSFLAMNEHQQAITVHENINNGDSYAHQKMADEHRKRMDMQASTETVSIAKPFSAMTAREQAAVAHTFTKNGQSRVD